MKPTTLLPFLLFLALGCGSGSSHRATRASSPKAPSDAWSVTTHDPNDATPAYLSNGLIGMRLGRDGTGNGQPFFLTDEYSKSGEEKIRESRFPLKLAFAPPGGWKKGDAPSPLWVTEEVQNYSQTMDFRTGVLRTSWTSTRKVSEAEILVESVVHPFERIAAIRITVEPKNPRVFSEVQRTNEVGPMLNRDGIQFLFGGQLPESGSRFVLYEPDSSFVDNGKSRSLSEWVLAFGPSIPAKNQFLPSFSSVADAAKKHLELQADIEIDGPVEDQQAIHSFLFNLRNSVNPNSEVAAAPMALSNAKYSGHVFWDADIWVFPVLALLDPIAAAAIPQYRLDRANQAVRNYRAWVNAGRPIGNEKQLGSLANADVPANGMMFPWESSVSGKETQPGESRFQHHVSGSVAFALAQAAALGLADEEAVRKVIKGVDHFYRLRIVRKDDGSFVLNDVYPPDESTFVDNDLYTNLVAQWCLNGGTFSKTNPEIKLKLPKDEQTFLTYDNDRVVSYKQAAAVLSIYPLQYPEAEQQAKKMMERFEPKVPFNGPAMTDSIHALIWARLGEKEKAYKEWRESWKEFTNHPLMVFSEKRVPSETYFVTGAAGCLQTVIYGFLGFRIDEEQQPGAAWSIPLKNGRFLSIKPNLPPAWKSVRFKNFHVLGKRYTLEATHTSVKVTPSS